VRHLCLKLATPVEADGTADFTEAIEPKLHVRTRPPTRNSVLAMLDVEGGPRHTQYRFPVRSWVGERGQRKARPCVLQDFSLFQVLRFGFPPSKVAFLAWHA
jgi:hypothetical protein